jgi:hypothetical protein
MEPDLIFRTGLLGLNVILIIVVAVVKVGMWWLRLAFIDLLAVILLKQIDMIGNYVGVDVFNDLVSSFVTLLALVAILVAFVAAHQRKVYLERAERERKIDLQRKHAQTIRELEQLRAESERRSGSWDVQHAYPLNSRQLMYELNVEFTGRYHEQFSAV